MPALPEWKQISSFSPGLSRERTSKLGNIIGQAQNKRRAAGWSRRTSAPLSERERGSCGTSGGKTLLTVIIMLKWIQKEEKQMLASVRGECA